MGVDFGEVKETKSTTYYRGYSVGTSIIISAGIYAGYHYGIFELREEERPVLPSVTIFYDATNTTTKNAAFDLERMVGEELSTRLIGISSGEEMLDCFNETNKTISDM